jgi:hypothetical protein
MKEVKKPEAAVAFWGSSQKQCPFCAETIPMAALKCPLCHAEFEDIAPVSREDLKPKRPDPALRAYYKSAVRMLVFSLLGLPSPFVLIFGGIWYRNRRKEIDRAGPTTRALVVLSLLVSTLYLVLVGGGLMLYFLVKS